MLRARSDEVCFVVHIGIIIFMLVSLINCPALCIHLHFVKSLTVLVNCITARVVQKFVD